jgi:ribonuclease D
MSKDESLRHDIVTSAAELEVLADELGREAVIGVDLEADSMFHFQERVCLLQIAISGRNVVVDTVALSDLSALRPVFRDPAIKKVFHGADYDVRSLYRDFDIRINNLFDTQLACCFLGFKETGLEAVLKNLFAVTLNKKFQRKDWSRRPLPKEMLDYAVSDVRHLAPLTERLEQELQEKGRLPWVGEECRILSKVRPAVSNGTPLFLNCKGAGRLDPRGLAVLEELLAFRRRIAREKDRPLFKVFSHETLLALADARPAHAADLEKAGLLSPTQMERYGRDLLSAIKVAMQLPAAQLPRYPRRRPQTVSAAASERIQRLRRFRETQGRRLKIDPALVCSKAAMMAIALRKPATPEDLADVAELRQWQRKVFGKDIIAALKK